MRYNGLCDVDTRLALLVSYAYDTIVILYYSILYDSIIPYYVYTR